MRQERLGALEARISGGTDGNGGGTGPVVVLLHGFGAPGDDLAALGELFEAPADTRYVFPVAPLTFPSEFGDSRAWWMIDIDARLEAMARGAIDEIVQDEPEGLADASRRLREHLEEVERALGAGRDQIVLGGFSQGSMVALDVALRSEQPFAGLMVLSGTLLCADTWIAGMEKQRGVPVLQSHGRLDPILPFALAERLRDHMREAGMDVDWVEFDGGHEIPPAVLDRGGALISRAARAR